MRIRTIRPNFWSSKTICALDWDARFVLKGLESYVDDNGVGKDDIGLIATSLFPRDLVANPRDTLARLSEAISRIHRAGLIARYVADGEELLYVDSWKELQRIDKPNRGRFPRPDGTFEYNDDVNRDSYRNPRDILANPPEVSAPVVEEEGSRGVGEEETCSTPSNETTPFAYPPLFEEFWSEYPRKAGKRRAHTAWLKARNRVDHDRLLKAAREYRDDPNRADEYTKHPEGWLNGDCWLDDPLPARNGHRQPQAQSKADIWTEAVIDPARAAAASRKELS